MLKTKVTFCHGDSLSRARARHVQARSRGERRVEEEWAGLAAAGPAAAALTSVGASVAARRQRKVMFSWPRVTFSAETNTVSLCSSAQAPTWLSATEGINRKQKAQLDRLLPRANCLT